MEKVTSGLQWRRQPGTAVGVLGHRGQGRGPDENTLEAFSSALAAGADGVELDVRLTSDGVPVVHHDAVVEGLGPIHEMRMDHLPDWLPTLAAALDVCAGAMVDVEIKNMPGEQGYDPSERLAGVVSAMTKAALSSGRGPRSVLVSSFSPGSLRAALAAGSDVTAGLLVHPAFDAASVLDEALSMGARCLLPYVSTVDSALVDTVHEAGLAVVVWTVNAPVELARMVELGADLVVTDDVAGALVAFGRT